MASAYARSVNTNDLAPFVIYSREAAPGRDRSHHVRGPGANELYPWPSYDAALEEVQRLKGELPASTLAAA